MPNYNYKRTFDFLIVFFGRTKRAKFYWTLPVQSRRAVRMVPTWRKPLMAGDRVSIAKLVTSLQLIKNISIGTPKLYTVFNFWTMSIFWNLKVGTRNYLLARACAAGRRRRSNTRWRSRWGRRWGSGRDRKWQRRKENPMSRGTRDGCINPGLFNFKFEWWSRTSTFPTPLPQKVFTRERKPHVTRNKGRVYQPRFI